MHTCEHESEWCRARTRQMHTHENTRALVKLSPARPTARARIQNRRNPTTTTGNEKKTKTNHFNRNISPGGNRWRRPIKQYTCWLWNSGESTATETNNNKTHTHGAEGKTKKKRFNISPADAATVILVLPVCNVWMRVYTHPKSPFWCLSAWCDRFLCPFAAGFQAHTRVKNVCVREETVNLWTSSAGNAHGYDDD